MRRRLPPADAPMEPILPWTDDNLMSGARQFPTLQTMNVPPGRNPAGMRTQPVIEARPRREGWHFRRSHTVEVHPIPTQHIYVDSSRFQPYSIGSMGNVVDTTATDWNWPPRFSGLWQRASVPVAANPGDSSAPPAPRFTRTIRVPRFSTLPAEMIPR